VTFTDDCRFRHRRMLDERRFDFIVQAMPATLSTSSRAGQKYPSSSRFAPSPE
jgi:hypothetical protein